MQQSTTHPDSLSTHEESSPPGNAVYRLTGVLLILSVLGFFIPFIILLPGLRFMDQPASVALPIFRQQSTTVLLSYYGYVWGGLLLILSVLLLYRVLHNRGVQSFALIIATVCGVMQAIGDLRWPFLLPSLASTYFDPQTSQATRAAIDVTFYAIDQFAGVGLTEHLYYLFVGAWSLLLGWYLLQSSRPGRWMAWLSIICGCAFFISSIEQFDLASISLIILPFMLLSRIVWGVLLLAMAAKFLWHPAKGSDNVVVEQK
jgi:hypothetical protein